ncbi:MAG: amino acid ABC transporter substrate-binding protein [Rhodospirillum sp.]|nr:amino acid ABC transporter substrate-binding protein [Rhodospirillum sp.]MCF8489806.1 amino acid ABC transporter substrate-binding protein [Rhodospirillum sp.]MCF8501611.1 amino acid ABC transporter substrate-binding protein [Rhodospirillum sp.]
MVWVAALVLNVGGVMVDPATAANGDTARDIRARGEIRCGTNPILGFGFQGVSGRWDGFFIDFCRAVAAAVLGDAEKVDVVSVETQSRWDALRSGDTDINMDGATWTLGRDTAMGFDFPGIYLYDGQRFLGGPTVHPGSVRQAEGKSVCVIKGTTAEANLRDFLTRTDLELTVITVASDEGAWLSFSKGRCDLFVNDGIGLALRNVNHASDPTANHLLTEVISKEPLGPVVRADDHQWFEITRWVLNILVAAEEQGLTQATISRVEGVGGSDRAVLAGLGNDEAAALGLESGWSLRVIKQVGNYGEIFDRHLGMNSPLKLERGLNALWTEGGLMYAPPLQ